jgi:hypothetical protein
MPTLSIENAQNLSNAAPKKGSAKPNAPSRRNAPSRVANPKKPPRSAGSKAAKIPPKAEEPGVERVTRQNKPPRSPESQDTRVAAAKMTLQADKQQDERVTKQERVLILLSRPDGASIAEMMQATNWQQHSVRGLLAGTVKKKLGFLLTSSKPGDGVRRYHIEPRRGR